MEAFWTLPNDEVWGLQAKYFTALGSSQKAQMAESVRQAAANYPTLTRYIICLPTNLTANTGAKAGKPKRGQHEKLNEWIGEWWKELARVGRSVAFELWDESELLGRLASADATGGLTRYWFDNDRLTFAWFSDRLAEAKAQAGARYSPELAVATPLDEALHAFGLTERWIKKIEQLSKRFSEKFDWWRRTANAQSGTSSSLPGALMEEAKAVMAAAEPLQQPLDLAPENSKLLADSRLYSAIRNSISLGTTLEPKLKQALLTEHGDHADSPGFRQWRAEYMADFPMAPLDYLRDFLIVLREIENFVISADGQLPAAAVMLLRGEAGVGKTHGILDTAVRRGAAGLLSLVFFGEDVAGPDPWSQFITKLGLENAKGRDAFLDTLNAAGEATGFPLLIFIDALNETQPDRQKWQSWLPPMIEQIRRLPFVRLCVSCREIYVREVMPPDAEIPDFEHNGFLGREYEAQFAFFQYYGLGAPAEPLLQEEFSNPLFLRLVCESLRDGGMNGLPAGRDGIRSIVNLLLRAKNNRAAKICDFDRRENRVGQAMLRLASAMASAASRMIPLADAKLVVDGSPTALSRSLFGVLEAESLIATVERRVAGSAEPEYFVRFTFERIGDHLIVEHLLVESGTPAADFENGGKLYFMIASEDVAHANAGILEALSIQLPETRGQELLDAAHAVDRAWLWRPFIAGLQWRNPQYVTARTVELVHQALHVDETVGPAFEAIFGLAARPGHPLNARFLHGLLSPIPMLTRDAPWANTLEESYSGWSQSIHVKSGVHRLIDTARRGRLDALPDEVAILWATALAWFCASPDRRIRDRATMAIVSIFCARPRAIVTLLRTFALNEDEYISERVILAAYGALLLNQSAADTHEAASLLYDFYFVNADPPLNASLRDHARLIIEMSVDIGVPPRELNADLYRPPYRSGWPIELPTDEDVKPYAEDKRRFPRMNLIEYVGLATGTDFARYIVEPRVTSAFDIEKAGLDKLGIFRWFLKEAADFGYPGPNDRCAEHDRFLLDTFGGGRGKPGWAERLGKKYYWIFLRRLVGQLADHLDRKTWSGTFSPSDVLQSLELRDIDPSDLREFLAPPTEDQGWLVPAPYVFQGRDMPDGDAAWIKQKDLTDVSQVLVLRDPDGGDWQALDLSVSWNGKRADRRLESHRHVTRSVRAAACDAAQIGKVKSTFASAGLDHFNNGPHDYRSYLGEYPQRWPYINRQLDPKTFEDEHAGITFQYLVLRQLRGPEWERDYSQAGESATLLMPSVDLVGGLRWDHCGGWRDPEGKLQIQDPWWWSSDEPAAMICRAEYLDRFLEQNGRALIILGSRPSTLQA